MQSLLELDLIKLRLEQTSDALQVGVYGFLVFVLSCFIQTVSNLEPIINY